LYRLQRLSASNDDVHIPVICGERGTFVHPSRAGEAETLLKLPTAVLIEDKCDAWRVERKVELELVYSISSTSEGKEKEKELRNVPISVGLTQ
jgi:hypothetical protein